MSWINKIKRYLKWMYVIVFCLMAPLAVAQTGNPFKINYDTTPILLSSTQGASIELQVTIPPGHYLYADKTQLTWQNYPELEISQAKFPAPTPHQDEFTGKTEQVYLDSFTLSVEVKLKANHDLIAEKLSGLIKFQGCSDELCLLPQKVQIEIPFQKAGTKQSNQASSFWDFIHGISPDHLLAMQSGLLYLIAFLGGLITCFTPCVFPIIPLTMSFIGAHAHKPGSFKRELMLVLGMVIMYCLLGLLAAWLGLGAGFLFKSKYFVLFLAVLFFVFALGMFEVVPFELPSRVRSKLSNIGGGSLWGALTVGLSLGFIASPCVGPLVGPFLLLAAQKQSQWFGASLLACYGIGMGAFFIVLAHGYRKFKGRIGGKFFRALKIILGILLVLPSLYYGWVFYNIINPHVQKGDLNYWQYDYAKSLSLAAEQNKPILVDFYADWCPPCVEMEHKTYSSETIKNIANQFIMLKVDCTVFNDQCDDLSQKFNVVGMPTIIFLNSKGRVSLPPVNGYKTVDQLVQLMQNALTQK